MGFGVLLGACSSGTRGTSGGAAVYARLYGTLSQLGLLFAHLLRGASDAALLHVAVFFDFGVHVVALEDDRQRKADDEKGDGSYGNQKDQ